MWQGSYTFIVNQWGVGHGGFHSQSLFFQQLGRNPTSLVGDGSLVRVIYDCGSGRTKDPRVTLKSAVGRMLGGVADGSTIDLLVISHFDRDHVNGLEYLAAELDRRGIHVTRVWAPVLTKIEALYAIAASGLTNAARQAHAAFVNDPFGQLTGLFSSAEITQIEPSDQPIPLAQTGVDTIDPDFSDITLRSASGGRGLVAGPSGTSHGEALWELQPYVVESTLVGAKTLSGSIRKLLGKSTEECSVDDLIAITNDASLLNKFHSAVARHHGQTDPKRRTSSARNGPNLSSLCVYSGPVSPYDWCHFRRGWAPVASTPHAIPIAPAWFGTGDAGLLEPHQVNAMRTALTPSRLDRVGISSAPHHGSRHDSGAALWDALPNARRVTIEANHLMGGTGNTHPHKRVLAELAVRNLVVHTSSDGRDFHWSDKRIR